jgi:hypothetical protein
VASIRGDLGAGAYIMSDTKDPLYKATVRILTPRPPPPPPPADKGPSDILKLARRMRAEGAAICPLGNLPV